MNVKEKKLVVTNKKAEAVKAEKVIKDYTDYIVGYDALKTGKKFLIVSGNPTEKNEKLGIPTVTNRAIRAFLGGDYSYLEVAGVIENIVYFNLYYENENGEIVKYELPKISAHFSILPQAWTDYSTIYHADINGVLTADYFDGCIGCLYSIKSDGTLQYTLTDRIKGFISLADYNKCCKASRAREGKKE